MVDQDDDTNSADRRRDVRVAARIEVRFSERAEAARALRAYSLNFSAGGLCLKTQREYDVGAQLHLAIAVKGEEFDLKCVVAWVRNGAIGVRFDGVSPADRARLEALAASLQQG
jgi:uncharacterized protein (TIGR02266 family)